jgi:hypothetical protein
VAAPARQRRLTVAFRLLLAVPQLIVLGLLGIVASVAAFLGWWGALFTGRLPRFADTFLSGYVRWYTRVYAYLYLLTDRYPAFTFDSDPWYPVRTAIPDPQRLNRAAVFFRFILVVPVAILANFLGQGASTLIAVVAWLITLITGRMPVSLHLAYAAVLRFQARLAAYWFMLTPAYPGGVFGDPPGAPGWTAGPQPAPEPYWGDPGYGDPAYAPQPVPQISSWQLSLTRGARRLLVTFIVLGAVSGLGLNVYDAVAGKSRIQAAIGVLQLNRAVNTLNTSSNAWQQGAANCGQDLPCLTRQDAAVAPAYRTLARQVAASLNQEVQAVGSAIRAS